jgi:hypothetical protein
MCLIIYKNVTKSVNLLCQVFRVTENCFIKKTKTLTVSHHSVETEVFINIIPHASDFKILNLSAPELHNDSQMHANVIFLFRAVDECHFS